MSHLKIDLKRVALLGCASCILASSFTLSSCGAMNDRDKTVAQGKTIGTTGGALAGGGIAFGIAKMFGLRDREAAAFATVGALVGAAVGYQKGKAWGESIVRQKDAYASTEDYLVANIDQANRRTSMLNSENKRLVSQISSLRSQRAQLAKAQSSAQRRSFNNSIASATQEITQKERLVRKDISNSLAAIKIAKKDGVSQKELAKLDTGVRTMQSQLTALSTNKKAIARLKL